MSYVIELGEYTKAPDGTRSWIGHGFYNLYEPKGGPMIIVKEPEDAFHFKYREEAIAVVNADLRISGRCRILEYA